MGKYNLKQFGCEVEMHDCIPSIVTTMVIVQYNNIMSSKALCHNHWPIQTHIYWRDNFQVKETKILGRLMDAKIGISSWIY